MQLIYYFTIIFQICFPNGIFSWRYECNSSCSRLRTYGWKFWLLVRSTFKPDGFFSIFTDENIWLFPYFFEVETRDGSNFCFPLPFCQPSLSRQYSHLLQHINLIDKHVQHSRSANVHSQYVKYCVLWMWQKFCQRHSHSFGGQSQQMNRKSRDKLSFNIEQNRLQNKRFSYN